MPGLRSCLVDSRGRGSWRLVAAGGSSSSGHQADPVLTYGANGSLYRPTSAHRLYTAALVDQPQHSHSCHSPRLARHAHDYSHPN